MSLGMDVDPGRLPKDWRTVVRTGGFVILLIAGVGFIALAVATPVAKARVEPIEDKIDNHLAEISQLRPQMDSYVIEERAARCSIARNVYKVCVKSGVECEPVEARCSHESRHQ